MRPREEIARLKARIAVLEGQLAAADLEPATEAVEAWAVSLTPQERALMGVLIASWPRTVDAWAIDQRLPHRDHAADRDLKLAATVVNAVRRKLGPEAIETVWGEGYRAGATFVMKKAA
jgi:DNA-binding response OmpR family regulator